MSDRLEANYAVLKAPGLQAFLNTLDGDIEIVSISLDRAICYVTDGTSTQAFDHPGFAAFHHTPKAQLSDICGDDLLNLDRECISNLIRSEIFQDNSVLLRGQ